MSEMIPSALARVLCDAYAPIAGTDGWDGIEAFPIDKAAWLAVANAALAALTPAVESGELLQAVEAAARKIVENPDAAWLPLEGAEMTDDAICAQWNTLVEALAAIRPLK